MNQHLKIALKASKRDDFSKFLDGHQYCLGFAPIGNNEPLPVIHYPLCDLVKMSLGGCD